MYQFNNIHMPEVHIFIAQLECLVETRFIMLLHTVAVLFPSVGLIMFRYWPERCATTLAPSIVCRSTSYVNSDRNLTGGSVQPFASTRRWSKWEDCGPHCDNLPFSTKLCKVIGINFNNSKRISSTSFNLRPEISLHSIPAGVQQSHCVFWYHHDSDVWMLLTHPELATHCVRSIPITSNQETLTSLKLHTLRRRPSNRNFGSVHLPLV